MSMELKIISPQPEGFVKQIEWNWEEIAKEVEAKVGYYKNLVYTDAQVVEAKKDRAQLNKFITALKAKDKEIKALCLAPYEEFHNKMLKIISMVEEPAELIDKQVKEFEEEQRNKKKADIQALFDARGFQPWVKIEKIMKPEWLNKSYSLKKIESDLSSIQHSIGEDILLINSMGEGQPAALREYQRSLDKTKAVQAGQDYIDAKRAEKRLAETINAQREEQARQAQEQLDRDLGITDAPAAATPVAKPSVAITPATMAHASVYDDSEVPERREFFFKVFCSRDELIALDNFLRTNGYTYRQIREKM